MRVAVIVSVRAMGMAMMHMIVVPVLDVERRRRVEDGSQKTAEPESGEVIKAQSRQQHQAAQCKEGRLHPEHLIQGGHLPHHGTAHAPWSKKQPVQAPTPSRALRPPAATPDG